MDSIRNLIIEKVNINCTDKVRFIFFTLGDPFYNFVSQHDWWLQVSVET